MEEKEKRHPQQKLCPRLYEVIDNAKAQAEKVSHVVVSCADRYTRCCSSGCFRCSQGPFLDCQAWSERLDHQEPISGGDRPPVLCCRPPTFISNFARKGHSARDTVALSGAHTLGQGHCFTFRDRIYSNGTNLDAGFASTHKRRCPAGGGDSNLAPLDLVTPNSFDNNYFKNLMQKKGLLASDQALFSSGSTDGIVSEHGRNPAAFKLV